MSSIVYAGTALGTVVRPLQRHNGVWTNSACCVPDKYVAVRADCRGVGLGIRVLLDGRSERFVDVAMDLACE